MITNLFFVYIYRVSAARVHSTSSNPYRIHFIFLSTGSTVCAARQGVVFCYKGYAEFKYEYFTFSYGKKANDNGYN